MRVTGKNAEPIRNRRQGLCRSICTLIVRIVERTNNRDDHDAANFLADPVQRDPINRKAAIPKSPANRTYHGHRRTDAIDPEKKPSEARYRTSAKGVMSGRSR